MCTLPDSHQEPIIDAHMHLWTRVAGMVQGRIPVTPLTHGRIQIGEKQVLGMPAYMTDCRALAEYFVAEMDAAGVSVGVVVQEYLDGQQNDYLLQVVEQWPGRFFVHGLPDWFDLDSAADQVLALMDRGFRGIKMPAMHFDERYRLDDPRLMPAYHAIQDAGAVLAVDLAPGQHQVPALRRVLDACPRLKIAIGHFGLPSRGGWPGQLGLCAYENVYLETGGIIWLYRHAGIGFGPALEVIHQAIDTVGAHKLMWGSDWPRTMVDFTYPQSIAFLLNDPGISDIDKGLICGGNAQRLYELRVPPGTPSAGPWPRITQG